MRSRGYLALLLAFALASCEPADPTSPRSPTASALLANSGPRLIQCPTNTSVSVTGTLTALGGFLGVGGHSIQVPGGALLGSTDFTLTAPASQYVEISIRANGAEHFEFEQPVQVTISYARCNRSNIDSRPLQVWYIDETTKELIAPMGGIDNKLLKTVTFWTDHFSGYAIAE